MQTQPKTRKRIPKQPADAAIRQVVQRDLELIGRRWTGAILQVALGGATRYSEIRDSIAGLSDRALSARLRELEANAIIERTVLPIVPVSVRYNLTAKGKALAPVLRALSVWCRQWSIRDPAKHVSAPASWPVVQRDLEWIGSRWTGAILQVILGGASRYSEVQDTIAGLSDRLLTDRLRGLETEGIIRRSVLPGVPVAVRYHPTEKGKGLKPFFRALSNWCRHWSMPKL